MELTGLRRIARIVVAALALAGVLPAASGAADETTVQFSARVSWIAANTMVVSTADSPALSIDLTQVPQDEYQRLTTGAYVIVTGTLGWRQNMATSIESLEPET